MKKITILAIDEAISVYFVDELVKIFGNLFEIEYKTPNMSPMSITRESDLILYTDPEILNLLSHTIKCDAPYLMMKRTITKAALQEIKKIPKDSSALVCNINQYMANETMALIHQLGITDVRLIPFYEGKKKINEVDYIITPEKYNFIPDIDAKIIVIGNRVFDISNVLDILSIMMVDRETSDMIIKRYILKVPTFWHGAKYALENRRVMISQWKALMDELQRGVMVVSDNDIVEFMNKEAEKYIGITEEYMTGKDLKNIFPENSSIYKAINSKDEQKDELINYLNKELVISVKHIKIDGTYYGKLIFLDPYTEILNAQQRIQKKLVSKGLYARYTFDSLTGNSEHFLNAKNLAKKISNSDHTVLLQGESGVGKELFAGAIHNKSPRKNEAFVAINCTTLPENLLESELFGYEEGAFTGAKKGGKIGLFEKANQGTLFLDEIGDLPLSLQARLLRAIEEKEIIRIGGDSIINVDVRIIAATNKNLSLLAEQGKFREDLYYRLNVLQINIPPLRKRKEDLETFIQHFMDKWEIKDYRISNSFKLFLKKYPWPGNIRELRNVLKYMITISDGNFTIENLPLYLKEKKYFINSHEDEEKLFLELIYSQYKEGENTGRRSLTKKFSNFYYEISEIHARKILENLNEKGLIKKNSGRKGNEITEKGIELV